MENEPPTSSLKDARGGWGAKRGKLMGKLFGRDRDRDRDRGRGQKNSSNDDVSSSGDLNDFLHGPSDTLQVAHAAPPMLAKLDIKSATRYPNALTVEGQDDLPQDLGPQPRSRRRRNPARKGLVVRFTDTYPEIIGVGGDECDIPTHEIAKHKKTRPPAAAPVSAPPRRADTVTKAPGASSGPQQMDDGSFAPPPLRRTQTGYSSPGPERSAPAKYLDSPAMSSHERRRSVIEIQQAEMREAEGLAFANAVRSASAERQPDQAQTRTHTPPPNSMSGPSISESPQSIQGRQLSPQPRAPPSVSPRHTKKLPHLPPPSPVPQFPSNTQPHPPSQPGASGDQRHQNPDLVERLKRTPVLEQSPSSSIYSVASSFQQPFAVQRQGSRHSERDNPSSFSSSKTSATVHDVVAAAADDAMDAFVTRTRHLFELFRLHSESVRPLVVCLPEELIRAGLWWFLTGRSALENAIRERPATPESQRLNDMAKQQAYADLAKAYWLSEEILPEMLTRKSSPIDQEVDEARKALGSNLRKLAVSMKRNGFLPPEEAFLPATIDRSIWIEYPQITQDIKSLLWGSSSSALSQFPQHTSGMDLLESLPLGDSATFFCFGRFHADVYLMEQGRESQRFYFPCFLSIIRPQQQAELMFVIASQNGSVQLRISGNNKLGVVWEDVRWRAETCTLDIRLPRGFVLVVQCSQQNYKMVWNMHDFSAKVHASLYPRQDENCIFRTTLRAFQYFDNDPQSRQFPKESTPGCDVALFERVLREGAATGPRTYHRGYRIAAVTGPRIKTLSGVVQTYTPQVAIQFGFLRGEANDPALSLKFDNSRGKGSMVLSFSDEQERLRMHSLLIGAALHRDEHVFCEVPLQGVWFSEKYGDTNHKGLKVISSLPWQRARVINHDNDGDRPSCVLADKLRVVYDFKDGTFTDRMNVAPGELRLRLDVHNPSCMMLFRQAQADVTVAVTEAMVSRELPQGLKEALEGLKESPTTRTFMFSSVADLHAFETAITGFKVLFDGIASAFAISRRRMVVPIYKKWEAGATRIQVVQQDGVTQLLAFFDDFAHGQCMGFTIKGTDVFETFSRSGKAGLKIDDAKFPLPKVLAAEHDSAQAAADAAFVCLDLPELPGEHDDISILFDSEAEREKLIACLPAPVKGSRLSKIKGLA
ncbi:hypothetical protein QBC46DRAFT_256902 [Diplogelasinospora grovesii]|uniref:Uncharacterized protein n=1 Tax=Diplogelasinospora grovesii TaxID=303347 RepID=A0AAN6NAJ3_9PEZI|nr:hypothetical protein QBC46DRAFT_256902 [Diplogelasinospora grovesii]